MTEHDDVFLWIELLMRTCGDFAQWHVLCSFDVSFLPLLWLAHVKQHESFAALLKRVDLADANFKVHSESPTQFQLGAGTPFVSALMLSNSEC